MLFLLIPLLGNACQPVNLEPPLNRKTPLFEYATDYDRRQAAVSAARQLVAQRVQGTVDDVLILSVEPYKWNDICLGFPAPDEICPDDQINGFLIMLSANGQLFEAHTDSDGINVRFSVSAASFESPQEKAILLLARQLNISPTEILVQSIEPVQWPDSCLGIGGSGSCLTVITPGFRIILEARGQRFEYHSNSDGSLLYGGISPAEMPSNNSSDPLSEYLTLSMQRSYFTSTMVEQLLISSDYSTVISNNEGLQKSDIQLTPSEIEQLANWKANFADSTFTIREDNAQWQATVHLYGQGEEALPDFGQEILLNFVLEIYAREANPDTK
ncbi:MAG: hypothetical protein BGO78_12410 [Chloroflexi bacterium 44-23]|nr:MAG: hypothetical protein BGO78_12410 [Chloroflexi bacterium 44-23]